MLPEKNMEQLHQQIATVITSGKQTAYRAINVAMTLTYWEIGRLIVEEEQNGKERADYGNYLIVSLAKRLQKEFGSGYAEQSLRNYRGFFKAFSIRSAVRSELTWTHYRLLMRVDNPLAREFYEAEAVRSSWSTRALERQIHSFYYERLLASRGRESVEKEAEEKTGPLYVTA
jgi:hypothetical protein